ncbi:MAG: TlpA family protein disulfide reductase [Phycisphaeraceae bacterium]|nr:TlpA family protein disulfide reductase [Phycisphaeraceae bacterium]
MSSQGKRRSRHLPGVFLPREYIPRAGDCFVMNKRVIWILTGIVALFVFTGLLRSLTSAPGPQLGAEPLEWSLVTFDNQTISSASQAGRVTVIEFWATWCGPCVQMVPHLKQLNEQYHDRGVTFISVSVDQDPQAARDFIAANAMDWLQAGDNLQGSSLADAWGVTSIPQAFVFSPEGKLLWQGHPMDLDDVLEQGAGSRQ